MLQFLLEHTDTTLTDSMTDIVTNIPYSSMAPNSFIDLIDLNSDKVNFRYEHGCVRIEFIVDGFKTQHEAVLFRLSRERGNPKSIPHESRGDHYGAANRVGKIPCTAPSTRGQ